MKCYVKLKLDDHQEPYWVCTRFGVCRRPLAETKCYYENCHGRQDISDIEIAKLTNKHIEVKPQISAYKPTTFVAEVAQTTELKESITQVEKYESISISQNSMQDPSYCATKGCTNIIAPPHKLYCSTRCQRIENKRKARKRKREKLVKN